MARPPFLRLAALATGLAVMATQPAHAAETFEARYDTPMLGTYRECGQEIAGGTYNIGKVCFPFPAGSTHVLISADDDRTAIVEIVAGVWSRECVGYGCRIFQWYPRGCGRLDLALPPNTYNVMVEIRAVGYDGPAECAAALATSGTVTATFS